MFSAATNTFSVALGAVGEEVGKYEVEVRVSAPGRNTGEADRFSDYKMSLDIREAAPDSPPNPPPGPAPGPGPPTDNPNPDGSDPDDDGPPEDEVC